MIEVLKQMVEALEWCHGGEPIGTAEAIEVGKQAIAELESLEPVAWMVTGPYEKRPFVDINSARSYRNGLNKGFGEDVYMISSLFTHPPQRTEQEPVAWMRPSEEGYDSAFRDHRTVISCTGGNWIDWIPLYTPPQRTEGRVCCQQYDICLEPCTSRGRHLAQRTWVGLAKEDRLCAKYMQDAPDGIEAVIDYIESKLKELNT